MKVERAGLILYVIKYQECVHFYENVLGLKKMFEAEMLTCFEVGSSYLMVELDNEFNGKEGVA